MRPIHLMMMGAGAVDDPYAANVVGLWHFDEAAGGLSFVDRSGKGHKLSPAGDAATSAAQAKFGGKSLRLNAANDGPANHYVTSDNSADFTFGGDFTVECFVYFYAQSRAYMGVLSRTGSDATSGGFQIARVSATGKMSMTAWDTGALTINGTTTVNANTWYHVAVDRVGSTIYLYVNGNLEGSVGSAGVSLIGGIMEVGRAHVAGDQCSWNGHIEELRVTKGVARYAGANFTPPALAYADLTTLLATPTGDASGSSSGTPVITNSVTINVTGGSGSYTYAWEWIVNTGGLTIDSAAAATTTFRKAAAVSGQTYFGYAMCKVTDTVTGKITYSPHVFVSADRA